MFSAGDKVVCIDANPGYVTGMVGLIQDALYIIDALVPIPGKGDGVYLRGVSHPDPSGMYLWRASRFRKIFSPRARSRSREEVYEHHTER